MSVRRPFSPIERTTISSRVRDDLVRRIASGELAPGAALPAERVLAEGFGVARTSVREAVQGLVALGIVERRGNRSYVTQQVPATLIPVTDGGKRTLRSLVEAWRILELCLVELAAARATTRERSALRALALAPAPATAEAFLVGDREFHAAIAAACGNAVLMELHARVMEQLWGTAGVEGVLLPSDRARGRRTAITEARVEHRAIAEAFVAGDPLGAVEAADGHLGGVAERIARLSRRLASPGGRAALGATRTVGM